MLLYLWHISAENDNQDFCRPPAACWCCWIPFLAILPMDISPSLPGFTLLSLSWFKNCFFHDFFSTTQHPSASMRKQLRSGTTEHSLRSCPATLLWSEHPANTTKDQLISNLSQNPNPVLPCVPVIPLWYFKALPLVLRTRRHLMVIFSGWHFLHTRNVCLSPSNFQWLLPQSSRHLTRYWIQDKKEKKNFLHIYVSLSR